MADKTINALPAAAAALFTDLLEIDNGASQKLTTQQLWDLMRTNAVLLSNSPGPSVVSIDSQMFNLVRESGGVTCDWNAMVLRGFDGSQTIDWGGRTLLDSAELPVLSWASRGLVSSNTVQTLNWEAGLLTDTNSFDSVDWQTRLLLDTGAINSVDWGGRILTDSAGVTTMDWSTPQSLVVSQGVLTHGTGFTVATLPAAGTVGRKAYVTDALAPAFGAVAVGTGAVTVPVFDNGAAWIVA